ncbi:MAG: InlB B-repeat-containing protein, partial [Alphaproteobacteria bacterium]|nr:InlB B-repeat-containing protein [Alphaproteobacteria bacterium]
KVSCTPCPNGYDDGGAGLTAINQCQMTVESGKYIATSGAATVTNCPVNNMCPGGKVNYTDTGIISACPTNSSTNGATGQASCTCNTGYNYNGGTTVTTNACVANTYTIKYNTNGGDGSIADTTCTYGQNCTVSRTKPTKTGYTFAGWQYGSTTYQAGATITTSLTSTNGGSVTLTAQWTAKSYTCGAGKYLDGTECKDCTSGYYCPGDTYTYNAGIQGRGTCPTIYNNSDAGASSNKQCYIITEAGKMIPYPTSGTEVTCSANYYCSGGVKIYYGGYGGSTACPENSSTNGATGQTKCTCNTGYNYNDGTTTASDACEANTYTIKYEKNGGSGTMTDQTCKYGKSCTLTANKFTKTGYKFNGWKNGENEYTDKESVSNLTTTNNGTVTLVAQWIPITFTVIYVTNGGSGTQMENTTCTYDTDCYITKNTYTRTGYTFKNWANYDKSRYFEDGANLKNASTQATGLFLYAQWEPITYTIRYNANGGDGSMTDKQCVYDTDCKLDANTFTKTGHSFVGWLYGANIYQDQDNVPNLSTENGAVLEFVAQWSTNARTCEAGKYLNGDTCETCPVNYYCKGGTWDYNGEKQGLEKCPAKSSTNGKTGQASCTCNTGYNYNNATETTSGTCVGNDFKITYDLNGGSGNVKNTVCTNGYYCVVSTTKPTKKGYNFAGWLYNSKKYESGAPFSELISTNGETITFTAKWEPITYIIRYDADGGSGSMADTTCVYNQLCYLSKNTYTKTGHRFVHWWVNDYAAGEYVDKAATQQDAIVIAKAYWLPIQIPCPAGQYLDGLNCKDCENEYYCEGSEAEGWSNGWVYDGGIHGRTDCPAVDETYGAAQFEFLDVLGHTPHASVEDCRVTFMYMPEWSKPLNPDTEFNAGYNPQANNRGAYFVSCDYNSDTK